MEFGNDEVIGVRRNGVDGKERFIECAPFTTGAIVTSGTKQGGLAEIKWTCDVVATANVGGLPSQGEIPVLSKIGTAVGSANLILLNQTVKPEAWPTNRRKIVK
ncbi:hypothetical protein N8504_05700 [Akkermansiaceae bacterium]|nr:hypothetical protein [Akkermansiaceae bacterium]